MPWTSPTVYLVQEPLKRDQSSGQLVPRFPLELLERYGQLEYLCKWSELRDGLGFNTERLMAKFRERLEHYSDHDYIVPVGNPALIAMATLVAADMNEGRIRILDWIRNEARYREVPVDMQWEPYTKAPISAVR